MYELFFKHLMNRQYLIYILCFLKWFLVVSYSHVVHDFNQDLLNHPPFSVCSNARLLVWLALTQF